MRIRFIATRLVVTLPYILLFAFSPVAGQQYAREAMVTIRTSHSINRFDPSRALGAALDGKAKGVIDLQLSTRNIEMMRSAGLQSLIYRLRTELANEVWHWNPQGRWSDPAKRNPGIRS